MTKMKNSLETNFVNMMERIVMYSKQMVLKPDLSEYIFQIIDSYGQNRLRLRLNGYENGEQVLRLECIKKEYPCNLIAYHEIYNKYFKIREYETCKFFCDNIDSLHGWKWGFAKKDSFKNNIQAINTFLSIEKLKCL